MIFDILNYDPLSLWKNNPFSEKMDPHSESEKTNAEHEKVSEPFKNIVERRLLEYSIPQYLINILDITGYLTPIALKGFEDNDLNYIETHAKNDVHTIVPKDDLGNYYGPFKTNPQNFKLFKGHRITILNAVKIIRDSIEEQEGKDSGKAMINPQKKCQCNIIHRKRRRVADDLQKTLTENSKQTKIVDEGDKGLMLQKPACEGHASSTVSRSDVSRNRDDLTGLNIITSSLEIIQKYITSKLESIPMEIEKRQTILNDLAQLTMKNSLDKEGMVQYLLTCIICKKDIIIQSNTKNKRPVLSNFYRHFMLHFQTKEKRLSNSKMKSQTLLNYFGTQNKIDNHSTRDSTSHPSPHPSQAQAEEALILETSCSEMSIDTVTTENNNPIVENAFVSSEDKLQNFELSRVDEYGVESVGNSVIGPAFSHFDTPNTEPNTKSAKWASRLSRRQIKIAQAGKNNSLLITDYFEYVSRISEVIKDHENMELLRNGISDMQVSHRTENESELTLEPDLNDFLNSLKRTALNNAYVSNNKKKYEQSLKQFCTYLYVVGGKLLYETLQSNLRDSIPSLTTVKRHLYKTNAPISEGIFRFEQLKAFLDKRNLPPVVWISEDGTKIVSKVEYCLKSNKNVGFVLPFKNNGLPDADSFKVSLQLHI